MRPEFPGTFRQRHGGVLQRGTEEILYAPALPPVEDEAVCDEAGGAEAALQGGETLCQVFGEMRMKTFDLQVDDL